MLIMEMALCSLPLIRKTHGTEWPQFFNINNTPQVSFALPYMPSSDSGNSEPGILSALLVGSAPAPDAGGPQSLSGLLGEEGAHLMQV